MENNSFSLERKYFGENNAALDWMIVPNREGRGGWKEKGVSMTATETQKLIAKRMPGREARRTWRVFHHGTSDLKFKFYLLHVPLVSLCITTLKKSSVFILTYKIMHTLNFYV